MKYPEAQLKERIARSPIFLVKRKWNYICLKSVHEIIPTSFKTSATYI